jgi:protein-disulfide isomerase
MHRTTRLALLSLFSLATHGCSHAAATTQDTDPGAHAPAAVHQAAAAAPAAAPAAAKPVVYKVPLDGLPSIGNPEALVTIVEFTDYQCPFCQRAEDTVAKLRATYGTDLRVVVAERPLPFHDRARPAALAALAADQQGKFEAMHARLFGLKGKLGDDAIADAAQAETLDPARFAADRMSATLTVPDALATSLGVTGTPTFFVNGRKVQGAQPFDKFQPVVEERLAAARALVASGTRPRDVYAALTAGGVEGATAGKEDDGEGAGCDMNCKGGPDDEPTSGDAVEQVPTDGAPVRGARAASTTIVAFGDFQCPFSAKAEASLRAVESAHPNDVRLVFKNLPLPFHDQARIAAKGALAADQQGRFWEFHDRLYARIGSPIDRPALDKIAEDLGLDMTRFARDIDDPATEARIARDEADAHALKVNGTPTFFVNGHRVIGAQPATTFEGAIAKRR